jgi:hypothetical protein
MSSTVLQGVEALGLVIVLICYLRKLDSRRPVIRPDPTYPKKAAFLQATSTLSTDAPAVLAARATDLYKTFRKTSAKLDAKIGTVLGFVAGGTGVFAVLTETDKITRPAISPLLGVSVIALVAVFVCSFEGLLPQLSGSPNVADLADPALLSAENAKSRMLALMGWENLDAARQLVPILRKKAEWLKRCYIAFSFGALALVLNAITPISSDASTKTMTLEVPSSCFVVSAKHTKCTLTVTEVNK